MSDISGFDWWFRNRDYVLRENLESLEASSAAAAARSSRLSSQLSQLQGSLDHRLNALSAAFDAYVQLGDIREQLAGYSETATIRREAMAAIAALGDGKPATPVDDRETGYWVAAATNAVIKRVTGAPDPVAEEALRGQDPDAALFLVAASGALGHGAELADQATLMLHSGDGQLDDHQLALWQAVVRGDFGPGALRSVLIGWHDHLSAPADWWKWAWRQGSMVGQDGLTWIENQASAVFGDHQPGPADTKPADADAPSSDSKASQAEDQQTQDQQAEDQQTHDQQAKDQQTQDQQAEDQPAGNSGLRGLVLELINAGFGDEKQLLATARELRARIEHPGTVTRSADDDHEGAKQSVVDVVRSCYLELPPSPAKTEIFRVLAPGLAGGVEEQSGQLLAQQPAVVQLRISGKTVEVTPDGPDRTALAAATAVDQYADPAASKTRLYAVAGATIGCAVIALVIALSGFATWLVVLLLIAAVILGILAVRTLLARRRQDEFRRESAASRDQSIKEATEKAAGIESAQRDVVRKTADQLDRVRALLSGVPSVPEPTPAAATSLAPGLPSLSGQQNAGSIS